jgi:hypothetical protein
MRRDVRRNWLNECLHKTIRIMIYMDYLLGVNR